jgi:hypothetical protein
MVSKLNASETSKAKDACAKNREAIKNLRRMMAVLD